MESIKYKYAEVDDRGKITLPSAMLARYGIKQGVKLLLTEKPHGIRIRQPATTLDKVYIEVTNACNFSCRTCMRNIWDEPLGQMSDTTFEKTVEALRAFPSPPAVFLEDWVSR